MRIGEVEWVVGVWSFEEKIVCLIGDNGLCIVRQCREICTILCGCICILPSSGSRFARGTLPPEQYDTKFQ